MDRVSHCFQIYIRYVMHSERENILNPTICETPDGPSIRNTERNYEVLLGGCIVTKKFDKVIRVQLGTILNPVDGTVCPVIGSFSEQGLESLLADLRSAPMPFSPPTQAEMNANTAYMWWVLYHDASVDQQFPPTGGEQNWGVVQGRSGEIAQLWVVPVSRVGELPGYAFLGREGFGKCAFPGADIEHLDLPAPPVDLPFHWHYYRRVNKMFALGGDGNTSQYPTRVRQILGWRCERTDQSDLICEIAIEDDGLWDIFRKLPVDDPYWEEPSHAKRIIASNGVQVLDAIERP